MKDKPNPYCLVQGYDGKTFAELGKTQEWVDSTFAGIGATLNDTRMWAEFQKCIQNNSKPIEVLGAGRLSRGVNIPKTRTSLIINFNNCHIDVTPNFSSPAMFYCDLPGSLNEAWTMADRGFEFNNAALDGLDQGVTGFAVGAGTRHKFSYNHYLNLQIGNNVQYGMQTLEDHPRYYRCNIGTVFQGYTHIPAVIGLTSANKSTVETPACWTNKPAGENYLLGFFGVEGCVVNSPVIEGATGYKYGIYFDDRGQTDIKSFAVNYIYQEMSENTAYVFLKMRDGKFELNGGVGHGTGLLVEAADAGQPNSATDIVIRNIGWWLGAATPAQLEQYRQLRTALRVANESEGVDTAAADAMESFKADAVAAGISLYKTYPNGPSWTFMITADATSQDWNNIKNQFTDPNVINPCSGIGQNCGYGKYQIIAAPR